MDEPQSTLWQCDPESSQCLRRTQQRQPVQRKNVSPKLVPPGTSFLLCGAQTTETLFKLEHCNLYAALVLIRASYTEGRFAARDGEASRANGENAGSSCVPAEPWRVLQ